MPDSSKGHYIEKDVSVIEGGMVSYYTTQEAADLVGVNYKRLWYALITGKLRESKRIGRFRLFDDYDIVEIRDHFARREGVESKKL